MSIFDVARYLSYSRSVDVPCEGERYFNLSMANSGRLFSCLYGDRRHWNFGREQAEPTHVRSAGKGM